MVQMNEVLPVLQMLLLTSLVLLGLSIMAVWIGCKVDDYFYFKRTGKKKESKNL